MSKIKVKSTSFEINKLITTTQLYSKIELSISARLVLRCIVDYWNFNLGYAFPTQLTISKCTGLTEVAVGKAVKELANKELLEKKKLYKRIYYYLTLKLLGLLNLTPKIIYVKEKYNKKEEYNYECQNNYIEQNLINKNNETQERLKPEELAKIFIKNLNDNPLFSKKIKELKEKYKLS